MGKIYLLLVTIIVGVVVALTYYFFEGAVTIAIDFIWEDLFDTNHHRLLIIPLGIVLSLAYFASIHFFDRKDEEIEEKGLGHMPTPTIVNYLKILGIGFLSLVAGASLGPEAILVPSCLIVGAYIGTKLFRDNPEAIKLLAIAGFIALFAAFFHSFIVGLLSVLLITKETKTRLSWFIILIAIIASGVATMTLTLVDGHGLFDLPPLDWRFTLVSTIGLIVLALLGYGAVYLMRFFHDTAKFILTPLINSSRWWLHAFLASLGLSILYLLGGPLIQFTGDSSIKPLIGMSTVLDCVALAGIVIAKIAAIAWSKASGYRGGLIFPSLFVITGLMLIINQFTSFNFIYGIIFGFAGMLFADRKVKMLL